jgi:hypothetical protein
MATGKIDTELTKLSPEFSGRLHELRPEQKVRAIVMLVIPVAVGNGRRQAAVERKEAITAVQGSMENSLVAIDEILKRFGGERLANRPNVLGALPVEINSAGVHALANCDAVKAVLEDQEVHPAV